MKNAIRTLLIIIFILIVAFIVVGLFLPTSYLVSRSIMIDAPAGEIHANINNLEKWPSWSPWIEDDPSLKVTIGDISSGVGASQSWIGKDGDGSLVITSSDPRRGVNYDLEFNQGQYKCKSNFIYVPKDAGTEVIWEMSGNMDTPVIGGYFASTMDTFVGKYFEKGLVNLKNVTEDKKQ